MTFPFGKYFGEIRLLADLQFQDGAKPFEDRPPDDPEAKDLLLYLGCDVLRTAHLVSTVTAVLNAMGFDFNAVGGPAYCCGIIHHMNGAREASRGYTAGSLRHFAAYRPQKVLMWCPSCNEHYDDVVKQEHVARVAEAAAAAGVDVLATVYHSCQREICDLEGRSPFAVINYVTLLAEAMGLPAEEDWFKRQRLAGDPTATFAEIQPWVEARGHVIDEIGR